MKNSVDFRNVSKSYKEGQRQLNILEDVTVSFAHGKFSILLGRSGSGKSSLLNLISGVDTPDKGSVLIGDNNITSLSEHERTLYRRRNIGIIFQFFNLIPTLTVLENVMLPCDLDGVSQKQTKKRAEYLLERVGLQERANSVPDVLSGGEQQRVAIARALIHDPDLIIADEPTGNLDNETGEKVLELLLELTKVAGKTLIMATHNLDIIAQADFVYRVQNGSLAKECK